jgi:3'-phosphoadenosine 5'-phosphosulfate sulfotransferase (PAPS reductase)/FAD synthetase
MSPESGLVGPSKRAHGLIPPEAYVPGRGCRTNGRRLSVVPEHTDSFDRMGCVTLGSASTSRATWTTARAIRWGGELTNDAPALTSASNVGKVSTPPTTGERNLQAEVDGEHADVPEPVPGRSAESVRLTAFSSRLVLVTR